MNSDRIRIVAILCFAVAIGVARGSWYDDYDAGIKAARAGQWAKVADSMTKAISGNAKEANNARTYGAIFINYHPFYYRGVANLNLGKYEQAIADLEKTSGPGELDLGSIDTLIQRAKSRLAEAQQPEPQPPRPTPQPPVVQPPTPVPVTPAMDSALRSRAEAAVNNARQRLQAAQQRKATGSAEYANALRQYTDANTRLAAANSNSDLNAVIAMADNATMLADSAAGPAVVTPPTATGPPTRPVQAADVVLADAKVRVRQALESYFRGDFDDAARTFDRLTRDMPNNAWIWAFLGASQWSQYAFETDEGYKNAAIKSFRRAKSLRSWKGGLPQKYFSKRIRSAFENTG